MIGLLKKNISHNNDYTNSIIKYGGYLSNDKENFEDLIRKSKESLGDSVIIDDKIVKMINYMSSIPYKLNVKVLNFIISLITVRTPGGPKDENNENLLNDLFLSLHPETSNLDDYKKNCRN